MQKKETIKITRVIDANFNRAKEGLRVCEDIARFILDDQKLTRSYKGLRHKLTNTLTQALIHKSILMKARDIDRDIGRRSVLSESRRKNIKDIFWANSQRVKESFRVLEEFIKLVDPKKAEGLKKLRYKIYGLEKNAIQKL